MTSSKQRAIRLQLSVEALDQVAITYSPQELTYNNGVDLATYFESALGTLVNVD